MEEGGRQRSQNSIHNCQVHSRTSKEESQGQPPLPLAFAALRTGLEGGGCPLDGSHAGSGQCAGETRGGLFCAGRSPGPGGTESAGSNEFHLL